MNKIAVVLLSGGMDSTTVASFAKNEGYEVHAITARYAEATDREIKSAKKVAQELDLKHKIIDITPYKEVAWYSALIHPESIEVPKARSEEEITEEKEIPSSYVPMRNTFLLILAAAYLESEILRRIEEEKVDPQDIEARIFIAANALDYSGYPDCRPGYYKKINELMGLASKVGTQYGVEMKVETPLLNLKKKGIVELAKELGAPLEWTWSCYKGGEIPCGECDACILRKKGFKEAGLEDPLIQRLEEEGKIWRSQKSSTR